ncbi:MAG: hypothetical protein ACI8RD_001681, partial [Bacillariaceae sp.]|jgi:hypothetical protein
VSIGFGSAVFFFGVSSTSSASKFRLSGSNQALIVDPLTESVAYETGFFPRLQGFNKNGNGEQKRCESYDEIKQIKCMSENC